MKKLTSMLLLCSALCCAASPGIQKLSADLAAADPQSTVNIIVQWKTSPDATTHQKVVSRGGTLRSVLGSIQGASYTLPASQLSSLANDPEVAYIAPDRVVRAKLDTRLRPSTRAPVGMPAGKAPESAWR
jgi:serine protease AprX